MESEGNSSCSAVSTNKLETMSGMQYDRGKGLRDLNVPTRHQGKDQNSEKPYPKSAVLVVEKSCPVKRKPATRIVNQCKPHPGTDQ